MGLVGLSQPVTWHSSREWANEYNWTAMTPELIELLTSKWHFWYRADWDYGQTTVYFFCVGIFIFALVDLFFVLRQRASTANTIRKLPFYNSIIAASRSLGARQLSVPALGYYSPPLSAVAIVSTMIVFFCVLEFAARPYLWPNYAMGNSPPIATRSGWVSLAMMPFLLVFATKVNFVGMLTGVSHEKLQVYHRWTAWIMYITSLIHTFPFIIKWLNRGLLQSKWNTQVFYWSGTAALVPQTWLVFMSIGFIRNRYYETFKKLHFLASILFIAFLFIHVDFRLTSWDYFWGAFATYGLSWFARVIRTFYNRTSAATLEALPDQMVKVTAPTKVVWKPGQHFFVRFLDLGAHAATSHPFTVASLPSAGAAEMYVRVHRGITARLGAIAQSGSGKTSRVLLDGPYGGFEGNLRVYDRALLLGGGSGFTFVVPILLDLVRTHELEKTPCKKVHVVWAVRTAESLSWFEDELAGAIKNAPEGLTVSVDMYVTNDVRTKATDADDESDTSGNEKTPAGGLARHAGRPDLSAIVKEFCDEPGTVAMAACGPESFNFDVGKAVSDCELDILRGRSQCSEIYLHQESYAW